MSKKTLSIILIIAAIVSLGAGLFAHYRFPNKAEKKENVILGAYTDLDSGITKEETTDEEIQATIDDVIESRGGIFDEAKDGTVSKKGDRLHIRYYNKDDGEEYATEGDMVLGEEGWPEEFSKMLDGVERSFGADIKVKNEDGSESTYNVVVLSISTPGELNDEYVKGLGIENVTTVDEMKADIKKYLDEAHENDYKKELTDYLSDTITDTSEVETLPEDLVNAYKDLITKKVDNLVEQYKNQGQEDVTRQSLLEQTMKEDEFIGSADEYIGWYAQRQAKTYLCMEKIAEIEGIETETDRLYSDIATDWRADGSYETLLDYLKENNRENYERQLLVDTVLEYLLNKNK